MFLDVFWLFLHNYLKNLLNINLFILATIANYNNPVYLQQPDENMQIYAPLINTHPRYFVTIKGHIDQLLVKPVELVFFAHYLASNNACQYHDKDYQYNKYYRFIDNIIQIIPNARGNFRYKIPLDAYLAGFCGWGINTLSYKIYYNNEGCFPVYPLINFNKQVNKKVDRKTARDNWNCNLDECILLKNILFNDITYVPVNPLTDYNYKIEISRE